MSAKFIDIPADEWEQTYCAEELAAERKADKKERGRASNFAFALTSLLEAGGVSRDIFPAVHVFLGKTKNHAPDEPVKYFSERDAGALLPGETDVADGSFRKRYVRAWGEIEAEQARTGKRFCGRRAKGSIQLASRKSGAAERKKAPEYFSQIAQAVVDVERMASRLRGKREDRFRRAGIDVWNNLPAFSESDITIRPKVQKINGTPDSQPKGSRRLDRFVRAAREMLVEASKRDDATVTATCKELAVELGKAFAEALDVEPDSAMRLLADTLMEAAEASVHSSNDTSLVNTSGQEKKGDSEKVRAISENENLHFSEQNEVSQCFTVDSPVHVEGEAQDFPDFPTWHEQNRERVAQWCDSDTEKRQMYEAEKALAADGRTVEDLLDSIHSEVKPAAFRHIDEQEKRKGADEIIYAEEFTV
jgi:hypothetical protein